MKLKATKTIGIIGVSLLTLAACSTNGSAGTGSENGGDGQGDSADEMREVSIALSPFQDTLLPIVGEEMGWFEEKNIDVSFTSTAWNAVMTTLASGSVDVAVYSTTGVIAVANTAPDMVYTYGWNYFTEGAAMMVRPEGEIDTIENLVNDGMPHDQAREEVLTGLEGMTIVTTMGTDMGKSVYDALESVGLGLEDVQIVDMDPDAGLAAFLSGTGDAYLGGLAQRFRLREEGMLVAASGVDLSSPVLNGFVTHGDFYEENPDLFLDLVHIMHRIIRFCDDDPNKCGEIITERLNQEGAAGLTVQDWVDFWQNLEVYPGNAAEAKSMMLEEDGIAYWVNTWESDNQFLVRNGDIQESVEPEGRFLMEDVWENYVDKYGADEEGY
jgi:ABC-type nitrate/sulfonate/bicarbonate transport system substrate-binding protein